MRIGIFGGAFNPVHNGHVVVSILVLDRLSLDRLFVVPTYDPPHRSRYDLAPFDLRFSWLKRVFEGIERIEVSDFERRKGGKSYSIDTVRYFASLHGTKPFFIIGEDWALRLNTWYMYEKLVEEANFVVYPRLRRSVLKDVEKRYPSFTILEDLPIIEISSTEVRDRVRKGLPIRGMVPSMIEGEVIEFYEGEKL